MKLFNELHSFLTNLVDLSNEHGEAYCQELSDNILQKISTTRDGFSPDEERHAMESFRKMFLPIVHQSEFCKYSYDKPRGYSGDYITQEMIYFGVMGQENFRFQGNSELGRQINALTLSMANPKANFERVNLLKNIVKCKVEEGFHNIASIGSGSCLELWDFSSVESGKLNLFLLDQDSGALECARSKISSEIKNITYYNEKILRFLLKQNADGLGNQDFIYLFGLLDYFDTDLSKQIVSNLWAKITSGGSIFLTNVHPDNPTRFWMEYVGDWHLIHKNKKEFLSLQENLPNVKKFDYRIDQFGVYQFLEIFKK